MRGRATCSRDGSDQRDGVGPALGSSLTLMKDRIAQNVQALVLDYHTDSCLERAERPHLLLSLSFCVPAQLKDLVERFLQCDEFMYKLSLNAVAAAAAVRLSRLGSRRGSVAQVRGVLDLCQGPTCTGFLAPKTKLLHLCRGCTDVGRVLRHCRTVLTPLLQACIVAMQGQQMCPWVESQRRAYPSRRACTRKAMQAHFLKQFLPQPALLIALRALSLSRCDAHKTVYRATKVYRAQNIVLCGWVKVLGDSSHLNHQLTVHQCFKLDTWVTSQPTSLPTSSIICLMRASNVPRHISAVPQRISAVPQCISAVSGSPFLAIVLCCLGACVNTSTACAACCAAWCAWSLCLASAWLGCVCVYSFCVWQVYGWLVCVCVYGTCTFAGWSRWSVGCRPRQLTCVCDGLQHPTAPLRALHVYLQTPVLGSSPVRGHSMRNSLDGGGSIHSGASISSSSSSSSSSDSLSPEVRALVGKSTGFDRAPEPALACWPAGGPRCLS